MTSETVYQTYDLFSDAPRADRLIATVTAKPMRAVPDVLQFGDRFFLFHSLLSFNGRPAYIECLGAIAEHPL